jgi:antitoxin YefM
MEVNMERIILDQDIHSVSDFRAHANSYLKQIKQTKRPFVLTQNGKSSAVVLDVSEYENLLEELELAKEIRQARNEIREGNTQSHQKVKVKLLSKFNI